MRRTKRFPLLVYRRLMDRLWKRTVWLALVLAVVWWQAWAGRLPGMQPPWDVAIALSTLLTLAITLFAWIARRLAYVEVRPTHIRLVTPLLRLVISYRRLRRAYTARFADLFPPATFKWADKRFLEPFFRRTVVVLEMHGYPLPPTLLRLFLPATMFSPREDGLVLLVDDWMELSTALDSHRQQYVQRLSR